MTSARPLRAPQRTRSLRVVRGRGSRRASFAPFVMFGMVVVAAMIGLVLARTSLDAGAFELTEMRRQIEAEEHRQEILTLEIASMESPGRVAPLAEEMGMVLPDERLVLFVEPGSDAGAIDRPIPDGETEPARIAMATGSGNG